MKNLEIDLHEFDCLSFYEVLGQFLRNKNDYFHNKDVKQ
jgi:hypothetical protein